MRKEEIRIRCKGRSFRVSKSSLSLAEQLFEEIQKNPLTEVDFGGVDARIMKAVLDYCNHHENNLPMAIRKPLVSTDLSEHGVSAWDIRFINSLSDLQELTDIVVFAKQLGIKGLLELGCAQIACILQSNWTNCCTPQVLPLGPD